MSVHYKFKSAVDHDTVTFDGLHISVGDLKAAISQQKRIGKTSDFDLQITNAQTQEVYVDDHTLIPKNTSLLVARIPLSQQPKKQWEGSNKNQSSLHKDVAPKGLADLSRMEGSEQDKINAMISQSTFDYDPSNYQKIRGQNQRGVVPANYTCYKCQKSGHWINDCPTNSLTDKVEIRRSTGIPRSFMVPVDGPTIHGAMITPGGTFAVPVLDREAYLASECAGDGETPTNAPAAPEPTVPDELICSLCRDLLTDAVMIPCCGNSFCDECIRGALLESEDHECPDCREKEIAPTTLIPNRFLRNSVSAFRNQTGYNRRMPHRQSAAPIQAHPPVMEPPAVPGPPNGPGQLGPANDSGGVGAHGEESDGSADDNITVTVPPAHTHKLPPAHTAPAHARRANMHRHPRYGPPPGLKPPGIDTPPSMPINMPRIDEQRASTPTIDERRDPMSTQVVYNRGPPPPFIPGAPPPRFNNPPFGRRGPPPAGPPPSGPPRPPFNDRFPREPFQPPPPGIKDSPTNRPGEDPLEAFNRMIREKEMRAKRREEERRRVLSGSPRSPRSPRTPRSRSPRSPRSQRSVRSPRSPPPVRLRSRAASRPRYSRSRSMSRGRMRRSPWSPRRRRTRERSLSLTRSPSPRRRHRSPLRYRSPLRSPLRSPPRSPLRSPPRSPLRSPPRSPLRSPPRSPLRSPLRIHGRSPPRQLSPHRFAGVYDELLSPPRRSVEPPYGARFHGPRNNIPPSGYPMGGKPIPSMGSMPVHAEPPPGYRGRYDGPPFEDIPPGVEPPVPGFEPSPFEKPPFGPPVMERDRLPPPNYRDPFRAPFVEVPPGPGYRDMPPPIQNEIQVHVAKHNFRTGHPYRDQGPVPFRDGQPFREPGPPPQFREGPPPAREFRNGPPQFRDNAFRNHHPYREAGFRENPPHSFREGGVPGRVEFRPPSADPREQLPPNYNEPNFREGFREEPGREHLRPGFPRPTPRVRGPSRRNPLEHERHREREGRDRERFNENRDPSERVDRPRDDKRNYEKNRDGRDERPREYDRGRDYEKEREREFERASPDKKLRSSPKRSRETREKKRSESRGRSRDRDGRREKKEERTRDKTSADRSRERKEKEKKDKPKDRKKKKREKEKEKDSDKKKKREKKEKKEKETIKKEGDDMDKGDTKGPEVKEPEERKKVEPEVQVTVKTENTVTEDIIVKKEESPKPAIENPPINDLYGEEVAEAVDKEIIQNYIKPGENNVQDENKTADTGKDEPFDGIELQVTADELDLKTDEGSTQSKQMLALLPELSKWEVDDDNAEKLKEPGEITSPEEEEDGGKVTSEVLKRAENAIFAKAINSLRPIEIKKISSDRAKLYTDDAQPKSSIQITVPVIDPEQRSIEINDKKRRYSKTPPPRLSIKDRLGGKVDDVRRPRDTRVVQSTVERVKSRSKTPKKDQPIRRVTVEKDRSRKPEGPNRNELAKGDRRVVTEGIKVDKHRDRNTGKDMKKKDFEKASREESKSNANAHQDSRSRGHDKNSTADDKRTNTDRERKKSTLDEAHFEPDYDENVESDNEAKDESGKKRSASPTGPTEIKKVKLENDTIKLDLTNVKKKPDSESESSTSEDTSSSSSSDARKRKKKKKRSKKKKKRAASESDSDSDSSSDDHKKKKKKRKHKKKSSKKKKKSKHK